MFIKYALTGGRGANLPVSSAFTKADIAKTSKIRVRRVGTESRTRAHVRVPYGQVTGTNIQDLLCGSQNTHTGSFEPRGSDRTDSARRLWRGMSPQGNPDRNRSRIKRMSLIAALIGFYYPYSRNTPIQIPDTSRDNHDQVESAMSIRQYRDGR